MARVLSEQEQVRREALQKIIDLGFDPYPAERFDVNVTSQEILSEYKEEEKNYQSVTLAGRLMTKRVIGKASFAVLQDAHGKIQIYVSRDEVCPDENKNLYNKVFKKLLDIGDFVGVKGYVFTTKTGETSIHVTELKLLSKSLRPLPIVKEKDGELYNEVSDPELR